MNRAPVTAIMPVRDGEAYLAAALDSILGQSEPAAEVVVVDDGSVDRTPEILAGYGDALRVLRQPHGGHAAAMNTGITAARAEILAFLDADDLWEPDALAVRLARLRQVDRPDIVAGHVVQFVSPELDTSAATSFHFDPRPTASGLFQASLIRRDVFTRVGLLDSTLPSAANIDWMSRARFAGVRFATIDDVVARRRLHRSNMGVTMGAIRLKALTDVVRMHHERTRASTPPEGDNQ